ncbi:MAG: hypothetical protein IT204_12170 [Fimbriimonadaceae bacterium]|nr:hypothetical protein [Fimbriimonadaceae bacterium]
MKSFVRVLCWLLLGLACAPGRLLAGVDWQPGIGWQTAPASGLAERPAAGGASGRYYNFPSRFEARWWIVDRQTYFHFGSLPAGLPLAGCETLLRVLAGNPVELVLAFVDGELLSPGCEETGLVSGALRGTCDGGGTALAARFNARLLVSQDNGPFYPPDSVDFSPPAFRYALVARQQQDIRIRVELLPDAAQPAGNYIFRPRLQVLPVGHP